MPVVFEEKRFNRVGRQSGTKKVVKDAEGNDKEVYVDEQGNVIDNTYLARQVKEDSIRIDTSENFMIDANEVADGDLSRIRDFFVNGANQALRLEAGGYTPEEKVAKAILKSGLPGFAGKSLEEVVAALKNLKA